MTLKPCQKCGEPTDSTRCDEHTTRPEPIVERASARARGYTTSWDKLSKRARRLQPWCSDCGSTEKLSVDHSEEAWRRHDAGLPIRLQDTAVVCLACNNRRGPARGERVRRDLPDRAVKPQSPLHTPRGYPEKGGGEQ